MTRPTRRSSDLDPDLVLRAYAMGVFPMAEHRDEDSVFWVEPRQRAILPLDGFHLSRSLRKTIDPAISNQNIGRGAELALDDVEDADVAEQRFGRCRFRRLRRRRRYGK